MGQKANLKTVRHLKDETIIVSNNTNLKKRFNELDFKRHLIFLFFKKNVLITNLTLNLINSYFFLNLTLFFCSSTIASLKKKSKTKKNSSN